MKMQGRERERKIWPLKNINMEVSESDAFQNHSGIWIKLVRPNNLYF